MYICGCESVCLNIIIYKYFFNKWKTNNAKLISEWYKNNNDK